MEASAGPDKRDENTWASPFANRRGTVALLLLAGLGYAVCAVPVLQVRRDMDPLTGTTNDHARNRYCASQLVSHPIRSLTRPLLEIYREDTSKHKIATWSDSPCTHSGLVFFLAHAPYQWAIEAEILTPASATSLYVLMMLGFAHVFLVLGLRSHGVWPGTLLVFPWLVIMALLGLATPLSCCLGLLAFGAYAVDRPVRGTVFLSLAVSSFGRWIVVLPAAAYAVYLGRTVARQEVRTYWRSWRGRAWLVGGAVCLAWSLLATALVWLSWKELPATLSPRVFLVRVLTALVFALALARWRHSVFAAAGVSFGAFFVIYKSTMMAWYIEPLMPLFALARRRAELLVWAAMVVLASQGFDGVPNLVEIRFLLGWLGRGWASLLG
jgi:hypothetical protein